MSSPGASDIAADVCTRNSLMESHRACSPSNSTALYPWHDNIKRRRRRFVSSGRSSELMDWGFCIITWHWMRDAIEERRSRREERHSLSNPISIFNFIVGSMENPWICVRADFFVSCCILFSFWTLKMSVCDNDATNSKAWAASSAEGCTEAKKEHLSGEGPLSSTSWSYLENTIDRHPYNHPSICSWGLGQEVMIVYPMF